MHFVFGCLQTHNDFSRAAALQLNAPKFARAPLLLAPRPAARDLRLSIAEQVAALCGV